MKKQIPDNAILIPDQAQKVFDGVIYDVYHWEQANFDDSTALFEMLKRPDTVVAVAVVDDKIIVLDDAQPHRGSRTCFPGGRVDPEDVSTLAAAKREIKEETGYEFKNWKLVDVTQPLAKIEWFIYVYVAWEVSATGDVHHDAGERITLDLKLFGELKAMIKEGKGHLSEVRKVFDDLESVDGLIRLSDYQGQEVDR